MRPKKKITPETVVLLLVNSALVAKLLTDYPDAESRLNRAEALAQAAGKAEVKHRAMAEKAALYYLWGRFDEGLGLAERVISEGGGEHGENRANALNTCGNIHLRRCEFDQAEKCFHQALEHFRKLKMDTSIGIAVNNLANISNIRGDLKKALQLYLEALDRFEDQNDLFRTAHVMHSISQIHLALKDTAQARHYLHKSLDLRRSIQDYRGIVNNLLIQVGIFCDEHDFDGAREKLRQADEVIEEHRLTDPHLRAYREGEAGIFHFSAGEYGRSEVCFLRLIDLSQQMKEASFLAGGYSWLGKTRVFKDGSEAGLADIRKGIELAQSRDLPYELKNAWTYMVECHSRLGQPELAEQAARNYAREAIKQGDSPEMAEAEIARLLTGK